MYRPIVLLVLLTGCLATQDEPNDVSTVVGGEFPLAVKNTGAETTNCFLLTPYGERIQVGVTNKSADRYKVIEINDVFGCTVSVLDANENDAGIWHIYTETAEGDRTSSQRWLVTVKKSNAKEYLNEDEIEDVIWLKRINHQARADSHFTISLGKTDYREICTLQTPDGSITNLDDLKIEGVRVFGSSIFVACRVEIGPFDENESLLGAWTLCGQYTVGNVVHKRCQPVMIENNKNGNWRSDVRPKFNHSVHFGGILTTGVTGTGRLLNCHVITPFGEDIVVTGDAKYPYLNVTVRDAESNCGVLIGPIEATLLGDWEIYATFTTIVMGFMHVRQPINLGLYDENNPFDQAYNVTTFEPLSHVVNIANTIEIEVTGSGNRNDCIVTLPSGIKVDLNTFTTSSTVKFVDLENGACRASIGPISDDMLGNWQMSGKFNNQGRFNEFVRPFNIIKEDPANPIEEERRVILLNAQRLSTRLGTSNKVTIGRSHNFESCHVRSPNNLQYKIMQGFSVPNVQILDDDNINCGITIYIQSEDEVGTWTLISREGGNSERRLEFTIDVNEEVGVVPGTSTIAEGNNLHIRLERPSTLPDTCEIIGPVPDRVVEKDENFLNECGYIIRNVNRNDNGKWKIEYGQKIRYTGVADISVVDRANAAVQNFVWVKDAPVSLTEGPEGTVYCRVEDPTGNVVFDGLGRCAIRIDRVSMEHDGTWQMTIGTPGRILTEKHPFTVTVKEAVPKAEVQTHVDKTLPFVTMTCSVAVQSTVTTCKFRDPTGRVLLSSEGLGEDRYSFYGGGTQLVSDTTRHECGLRIKNPATRDLGLWRCALETDTETFYGFPTVLCPWASPAPGVPTEPTLTSDRDLVVGFEGDPVTMRCSVQSPIRYCYFRSPNGTTFSVSPSTNHSLVEYVGEGFDAGECGIRFSGLVSPTDGHWNSETWSCHVGFPDASKPEQRARITLDMTELMTVEQHGGWGMGPITIRLRVAGARVLDYCRFVRIDGLGFTSENAPKIYSVEDLRSIGQCRILIPDPTVLDIHPWTVAVRIRGQDVEIVRTTTFKEGEQTTSTFAPTTVEDAGDDSVTIIIVPTSHSAIWIFIPMIILGVVLVIFGWRRFHQRRGASNSSFIKEIEKPSLVTIDKELENKPSTVA